MFYKVTTNKRIFKVDWNFKHKNWKKLTIKELKEKFWNDYEKIIKQNIENDIKKLLEKTEVIFSIDKL